MELYPAIEPYDSGLLGVGDENSIYWEACGNPNGKPAVVVHGGPGSGAGAGSRLLFDPEHYRVVHFDQRGCGRSRPHASDPATDMGVNTTHHLIADMERLREHLGIDSWLLYGGSWGSTLILAYAERHPEHVSEIVIAGVTTTRPSETDWLYRGVSRFLPAQWQRFRAVAGSDDVVRAYARLMENPDFEVRERAAAEWVAWEDAVIAHESNGTPGAYGARVDEARLAFVRICTHYFAHDAWLEDGELLRNAHRLRGIPGVLIHGRLDLGSPLQTAWELEHAWPGAALVVVDGAGHTGSAATRAAVLAATDGFKRSALRGSRPPGSVRPMDVLRGVVAELAEELRIPGVAAGVLLDGREEHAFHGVTSIENPLPVDERTLFLCGSTTKTFTATAIVRLVGQGLVDLDAPARTYVPELRIQDEEAAASVTVLQLLNHTSGWDGDFFRNTGEGDDALARYVEAMAGLRQLTRPGEAVSYNNAAFGVAGRLIEHVTGSPYETALRELLLDPLDLHDTLFFPRDLLTRRVAVDHQRLQDGGTNSLPFGFPRATNPAGGLATTTRDLVAWARFHLDSGGPLLSPELAHRMHAPTVEAPGWSAGDAVGISWLLSDVANLRVMGHGGATLGQLSLFKIVPERGFALVSCTNCSPVGDEFNERIMKWAWETLLDAPIPDPETVARTAEEVAPYCGRYETIANLIDVTADADGLALLVTDRPELLQEFGVELEQEPPIPFLFREGHADRIVCTMPPHRGSTGFFLRDEAGRVTAMNAFGRHAVRTS